MFFRSLSSTSLRHTALFFCKIFRHSRMPWRVDQEISSPHHRVTTIYHSQMSFAYLQLPFFFIWTNAHMSVQGSLVGALSSHLKAFASVNLVIVFLYLFCSFCSLFPTFPTVPLDKGSLSSLHFSKWLKVVDSQGFSNSAIQTTLKLRGVQCLCFNFCSTLPT